MDDGVRDQAARAVLIVIDQQTVRPITVLIKPTHRVASTHHY
jgi:hypothetical protein